MTPALRWAVMSHFNVFVNCAGQNHKTVSTNHLFEENGESKRNRAEALLLTSLTPYRQAKPAHEQPRPQHIIVVPGAKTLTCTKNGGDGPACSVSTVNVNGPCDVYICADAAAVVGGIMSWGRRVRHCRPVYQRWWRTD